MAEVVADVKPDIGLMLWDRDRHPDHETAAAVSKLALRQPGMILGRDGVKTPRQVYAYDNGPGHTIGFEPNTFVDVTSEWPAAMEWLGQLMAFVRNLPYDPQSPDASLNVKEILARYRGLTCGVKYAEAVWATGASPRDPIGTCPRPTLPFPGRADFSPLGRNELRPTKLFLARCQVWRARVMAVHVHGPLGSRNSRLSRVKVMKR